MSTYSSNQFPPGRNIVLRTSEGSTASDQDPSLGIHLQCPCCNTIMDGFHCPRCAFKMCISHGIVHALPPERAKYYARFMKDYEQIRAAEGRGSETDDFYLALPYKDISSRNSNQWSIRARSYDYLLKHILRKKKKSEGRILDLGAGNCWMSFRLALAGYYPFALDLLTNDHDGLGAAVHYQSILPELFPRFQAEIARLPFQDEQFDSVIFNASFHYSTDYVAALGEALRCVKSGGLVIISDTPWYSREDSGKQMVSERQASFLNKYGTASNSIESLEYLTDKRLRVLEEKFSIRWSIHSPRYGIRWAMRPFAAKLRNRREPSRFRIYVARKNS